jgi:hypothetical protein
MKSFTATLSTILSTIGFALGMSLHASPVLAAEPRFDATYFFQGEDELKEKQINFADMARYSRQLQLQIWKALKPANMPPGNGYLVIAVRADQAVAVWLDMAPALSEEYQEKISAAVKKVSPFAVAQGTVVFGIQMSINTAKHTQKSKPAPAAWQNAKRQGLRDSEIETLVGAIWPDDAAKK